MEFSRGARLVEPFLAMEIFERAQALRAAGRDVFELCVGEPNFLPPAGVLPAARRAMEEGHTKYTDSRGLLELRRAIVADCQRRRGVTVREEQVIVTSGTSQALVLVFHLLLDPGDQVLIPAPYYPCYPNIVRACGGEPVFVPTSATDAYCISPAEVRRRITPRTKALLLASPANPTGAVQPEAVVRELAEFGVPIVSDEIYDGLLYDGARVTSPLTCSEDSFVLDGFSKRYAMTGFRLGYAIVPRPAARLMQSLQQNLFISAGHFVQFAGVAALQAEQSYLVGVCSELERRREVLVSGLERLGFGVAQKPAGAFYALVDARRFGGNSLELSLDLLSRTGVAVAPGRDFGELAEGYLRFSYCAELATIEAALERLASVA